MTRRDRRLQALVTEHRAAVSEFVARAASIDEKRWLTPRAEGKWTPAQETTHVMKVYDEFLRQLRGSTPMRVRGGVTRRMLSRLIGLTSILWFKRIPVAVRAPREVRPEWTEIAARELLPDFQRRTGEFEAAFERAWRDQPRRPMTHPLFGRLTLDQGIRFITVHTRHHAAFLPPTS